MAKVKLANIVAHCNRTLKPESFEDWPGAVNGLQVENRGGVSRIAAAVDATPATVKKTIAAGADLLIVHHGLFWGATHPWTGNRYRLLRLLLDNNVAVYSSHLPLDAHPRLGNNAQLCRALGIRSPKPFFVERGQAIGLRGELNLTRAQLARRLAKATDNEPTVLPGGAARCRKIGVVTENGRRRGRGHIHHRGRPALDVRAGRGSRSERVLRRPLRDGDIWREGAQRAFVEKVQAAVDVHRSPDRPVMPEIASARFSK